MEHKTASQLEFLDTHPAAPAVSCQYEIVSENDGKVPVRYAGPASCSREDLLWCNFVGGASVLMLRRTVFAELPSFERHPMQTPTPRNPLGAKGIGESGTIGSTPAVQNAVIDALAHLGTRHLDMPFTAERVWREINARG